MAGLTKRPTPGDSPNIVLILSDDLDYEGLRVTGRLGQLRVHKSITFARGMRVLFIAHWPKTLPSAQQGLVMGTDLLPCIADWLDIKPPADRSVNGRRLVYMLTGQPILPHKF